MNYQRGDIILADLPFSDGSGSKIRPALVVQSDRNNARLDDVILALITRTTRRATLESLNFSWISRRLSVYRRGFSIRRQ